MTDAKTTISTRLLKALAAVAYDGYDRPRINGILFRGGELVATDGHRLVLVPFEHHADFYMPRDLAVASVAAMSANSASVIAEDEFGVMYEPPECHDVKIALVDDGKVIEVDIGGVQLRAPAGDIASFPPVGMVFEKQSPTGNAMGHLFNPQLLAGLWPVIEAVEGANRGAAMVSCGSASDAMIYRSEGGITFALMPMLSRNKAKEAA